MQSVTVLTPHGRRYAVKVEQNKTILWILEEVCKKYTDFDPARYDLKHHNKILDITSMIRFTGLPNNSTLEMVEVEKPRTETEMDSLVICLQLEDGTRLNGNFPASTTLIEVINKLCAEKASAEMNPNVIYMRSECCGEDLKTTTLRSLGLSSGRALLRLINADPEMMKVQANVSAPLPQKPKEESENVRSRSNVKATTMFEIDNIKRIKQDTKQPERMETEQTETEVEDQQQIAGISQPMDIASTPKHEPKVQMAEEHSEPEPVIHQLDERGTIIFALDTLRTSSMDLPDSFFDLTESDIRRIYANLRHQAENLQEAPLMTAEMRKLEENKKILNQLSIYKFCAIRIQLPNRHVIQTKFRTVDTVNSVMNFVREFLVDPTLDFHLFMTPPKTVLEKEITLIEAHCVPSALLHFGCNNFEPRDVLKPEFYEKLSSGTGASRVLMSQSDEQSNDGTGSSGETSKKSEIPKNFLPSKAASTSAAMPKWFKSTGK